MATLSKRVIGWITTHPRLTLALTVVLTALAALPVGRLDVTSSRRALVDESHPSQQIRYRIDRRFPASEPVLVVFEGADPAARRDAVRGFVETLEQDLRFRGRVRAIIDPIASSLLRFAATPELIRALQEHRTALEAGRLGPLLAGLGPSALGGLEPERADEVARALLVLDAYLSGEAWIERWWQERAERPAEVDEAGFIVAGDYHLVLVHAELESDTVEAQSPIIEAIRAARDASVTEPVRAFVTGSDAVSVDERDVIRSGIVRSGIGTAVGILLVLLVAFRSVRRALLAVIPMAFAIVWSYGFIALVFGTQNLVTANFTAVLMGLGIDFAIHLLARSLEARESEAPLLATQTGWRLALAPLTIGALTSILAFTTVTTTEFTAFAQMGWTSTFGLAVMWALTLIAMPALMVVGNALDGRTLVATATPLGAWMERVIERARWPILAAALLALLAVGAVANELRFNPRHHDFLPSATESARGLAALEDSSQTPFYAMVEVDSLEEARRLAAGFRELESVGRVETPSDLLPDTVDRDALGRAKKTPAKPVPEDDVKESPEALGTTLQQLATVLQLTGTEGRTVAEPLAALAKTLRNLDSEGRARWKGWLAALPGFRARVVEAAEMLVEEEPVVLPEPLRHRLMSRDGTSYAVYAYPAGDFWNPARAERFLKEVATVESRAGGPGLTLHRNAQLIVDGFRRATLLAFVLVFLVVWADLRRLLDALLALVPVTLGLGWMLGTMAVFDLPFNAANVVVLPIILGIGADSGVHLVHRSREEGATLCTVVSRTGLAVSLSTLTTGVGFAALLLAEHGAMRSFGRTMLIGLAGTWVAGLWVLPSALVAFRRLRPTATSDTDEEASHRG